MVGGEKVALVDRDQDRVLPVLARGADQAGEEGRGLDDPLLGVEVGQV